MVNEIKYECLYSNNSAIVTITSITENLNISTVGNFEMEISKIDTYVYQVEVTSLSLDKHISGYIYAFDYDGCQYYKIEIPLYLNGAQDEEDIEDVELEELCKLTFEPNRVELNDVVKNVTVKIECRDKLGNDVDYLMNTQECNNFDYEINGNYITFKLNTAISGTSQTTFNFENPFCDKIGIKPLVIKTNYNGGYVGDSLKFVKLYSTNGDTYDVLESEEKRLQIKFTDKVSGIDGGIPHDVKYDMTSYFIDVNWKENWTIYDYNSDMLSCEKVDNDTIKFGLIGYDEENLKCQIILKDTLTNSFITIDCDIDEDLILNQGEIYFNQGGGKITQLTWNGATTICVKSLHNDLPTPFRIVKNALNSFPYQLVLNTNTGTYDEIGGQYIPSQSNGQVCFNINTPQGMNVKTDCIGYLQVVQSETNVSSVLSIIHEFYYTVTINELEEQKWDAECENKYFFIGQDLNDPKSKFALSNYDNILNDWKWFSRNSVECTDLDDMFENPLNYFNGGNFDYYTFTNQDFKEDSPSVFTTELKADERKIVSYIDGKEVSSKTLSDSTIINSESSYTKSMEIIETREIIDQKVVITRWKRFIEDYSFKRKEMNSDLLHYASYDFYAIPCVKSDVACEDLTFYDVENNTITVNANGDEQRIKFNFLPKIYGMVTQHIYLDENIELDIDYTKPPKDATEEEINNLLSTVITEGSASDISIKFDISDNSMVVTLKPNETYCEKTYAFDVKIKGDDNKTETCYSFNVVQEKAELIDPQYVLIAIENALKHEYTITKITNGAKTIVDSGTVGNNDSIIWYPDYVDVWGMGDCSNTNNVEYRLEVKDYDGAQVSMTKRKEIVVNKQKSDMVSNDNIENIVLKQFEIVIEESGVYSDRGDSSYFVADLRDAIEKVIVNESTELGIKISLQKTHYKRGCIINFKNTNKNGLSVNGDKNVEIKSYNIIKEGKIPNVEIYASLYPMLEGYGNYDYSIATKSDNLTNCNNISGSSYTSVFNRITYGLNGLENPYLKFVDDFFEKYYVYAEGVNKEGEGVDIDSLVFFYQFSAYLFATSTGVVKENELNIAFGTNLNRSAFMQLMNSVFLIDSGAYKPVEIKATNITINKAKDEETSNGVKFYIYDVTFRYEGTRKPTFISFELKKTHNGITLRFLRGFFIRN